MVDKELRELERKIFIRYFEDGFWDMYIGLLLFAFGLTITFEIGYLAGVFASLGFLIPRLGKSKVTYPRVGYIKFRNIRKKNVGMILLGVMILGAVLFFFLVGEQNNSITDFLRNNLLLVIALIWGGALAVAASILNIGRYFFYAVIIFIGFLISDRIGSLGINLITAGIVIFVIGLMILILFIRKYPLIPKPEKTHE